MSAPDVARRDEIAANLATVRARIAAACADAGRDPAGVTLVAITKTHPASDVLHLAHLGVGDIGENRDQEAAPKAAEVQAAGVAVRWHFVGQLQRNKCPSVAGYAHMVHTVDRVRLAVALDRAAQRHGRAPLPVLVQVSLDGVVGRGGAVPEEVAGSPMPDETGDDALPADHHLDRVLAAVAAAPSLSLRGLMTVAPLEWEPERAFDLLAGIAARVRRAYPAATVLSAGMSGDLEQAIRYGATHVRIGTALLGNRAPLM